MNQKLYLKLLPEYNDVFSRLSDADIATLVRYIMQYLVNQDIAPLCNPLLDMAFAALKINIIPLDGRSATSSENGKLGGRPSKKKPKHDLGFSSEIKEQIASPPNNKKIIKEELFNIGNIQSDNISSCEDNYLPSSTENNILPIKEEGRINSSSQEKRVSEIEERPADKEGAEKKTSKESIDFGQLLSYFNSRMAHCAIKPISRMTDRRKDAVGARMREYGKEAIQTAIDNAAASDLMNGKNNRNWVATFDWIFLPNNFPKVLEGNYENKTLSYEEDRNEINHRQRLDRHAGVVQRLLDEASRDPDSLANRLKAAGDIRGVPDDADNRQRG